MMLRLTLALIGVAFLCLAAGVARRQKRARQCEMHQRSAGAAAIVIAISCILLGIALIVWALFADQYQVN